MRHLSLVFQSADRGGAEDTILGMPLPIRIAGAGGMAVKETQIEDDVQQVLIHVLKELGGDQEFSLLMRLEGLEDPVGGIRFEPTELRDLLRQIDRLIRRIRFSPAVLLDAIRANLEAREAACQRFVDLYPDSPAVAQRIKEMEGIIKEKTALTGKNAMEQPLSLALLEFLETFRHTCERAYLPTLYVRGE